jgi:hypothetical protein
MPIPTRAKRVGLEWCDCDRWRLGCVDLYVGQEVGLREREQKGTEGVLPSLAPDAKLGL